MRVAFKAVERGGGKLLAASVAVGVLTTLALGAVGPSDQASAADSDVVFSEVCADNGCGASGYSTDWIEIYNKGSQTVDLSGWKVTDDKGNTAATLSGYIAPGKYRTFDADGLGNGGDSVTLSGSNDSYTWTKKAGDGETWHRDKGAGSWKNGAPSPTDNGNQQGGTEGGGTEIPSTAAKLQEWPGPKETEALDAVDEYGQGGGSTKGDHKDGNLSGLAYEPSMDGSAGTLWAIDNDLNPTMDSTEFKGPGAISKWVPKSDYSAANPGWQQDPNDDWTFKVGGETHGGKQLRYPGIDSNGKLNASDGTHQSGPDTEGITLVRNATDGQKYAFAAAERDNGEEKVEYGNGESEKPKNVPRYSILVYNLDSAETAKTNLKDQAGDNKTGAATDVAKDLTAVHEYQFNDQLSQKYGVDVRFGKNTLGDAEKDRNANLGFEGITFLPDSYLVAHQYQIDGNTYQPSGTAHYGGLFLAGLEQTGNMYLMELDENGTGTILQEIKLPQSAREALQIAADGKTYGKAMTVADLFYDSAHDRVVFSCDNTCGGAGLTADGKDYQAGGMSKVAYMTIQNGAFTVTDVYKTPEGRNGTYNIQPMNAEGFAMSSDAEKIKGSDLKKRAPYSTADDVDPGKWYKPVYWTDDGVGSEQGVVGANAQAGHSLYRGYIEVQVPNPDQPTSIVDIPVKKEWKAKSAGGSAGFPGSSNATPAKGTTVDVTLTQDPNAGNGGKTVGKITLTDGSATADDASDDWAGQFSNVEVGHSYKITETVRQPNGDTVKWTTTIATAARTGQTQDDDNDGKPETFVINSVNGAPGMVTITNTSDQTPVTPEPTPAQYQVPFVKTVKGLDTDDDFDFSLTKAADETKDIQFGDTAAATNVTQTITAKFTMDAGTKSASHTGKFPQITFKERGVYHLTAAETSTTTAKGWTYDNTPKDVCVVVTANAGTTHGELVVKGFAAYNKTTGCGTEVDQTLSDSGPTFTNVYQASIPPAGGQEANLAVTKIIPQFQAPAWSGDSVGAKAIGNGFAFTVQQTGADFTTVAADADAKLPDGAHCTPIDGKATACTVTVNADSSPTTDYKGKTAPLGTISFDKAGTWYYTVTENARGDTGTFNYSKAVYHVTITVSDDATTNTLKAATTIDRATGDTGNAAAKDIVGESMIFTNEYVKPIDKLPFTGAAGTNMLAGLITGLLFFAGGLAVGRSNLMRRPEDQLIG
ncbi:bifunctional metallophosphatase/5'-nucleotidase [Bifidobacterium margollesii]|uniref:Bifunctional metallophosphatase/5'-nucleotidase n=1 Tax=Bifidobacterium margollesii TaxID=2020964 RepID=A0A2N5JCA9_9BIFI|nr:FctA domain-containing protein [Bifidobacterium margollesii]PLS31844.1 bifunctional metallophosphatase/5'-nucleotidase [Bifidobacterium margollesii]